MTLTVRELKAWLETQDPDALVECHPDHPNTVFVPDPNLVLLLQEIAKWARGLAPPSDRIAGVLGPKMDVF